MIEDGTKLRRTDILRASDLLIDPALSKVQAAPIQVAADFVPPNQTGQEGAGAADRVPPGSRVSLSISAQLTQVHEVDAGKLSEWARKVSGDPGSTGTIPDTIEAILTLAVAATLQKHPTLNAQYNQDRGEITYHAEEHITFATTHDDDHREGILAFAGNLTVNQAASRIAAIKANAGNSGTSSAELEPTFTVVNIGAVRALFESPIIVQPQVAILALGAVAKRLVVHVDPLGQEATVVRPMMYLSLTYDHRLVDGADAGRFLQALIGRLTSTDFYTSLP